MRNGSYYFSLPGFVCADFYDAVQTVVYTNSECKNITYVRQSQLLKIQHTIFISDEKFRIHYFRVKIFFDHGYDVSRTQEKDKCFARGVWSNIPSAVTPINNILIYRTSTTGYESNIRTKLIPVLQYLSHTSSSHSPSPSTYSVQQLERQFSVVLPLYKYIWIGVTALGGCNSIHRVQSMSSS